MIHQDASTRGWAEEEKWDLAVTMDDATSDTAPFSCVRRALGAVFGVCARFWIKRGGIIW